MSDPFIKNQASEILTATLPEIKMYLFVMVELKYDGLATLFRLD